MPEQGSKVYFKEKKPWPSDKKYFKRFLHWFWSGEVARPVQKALRKSIHGAKKSNGKKKAFIGVKGSDYGWNEEHEVAWKNFLARLPVLHHLLSVAILNSQGFPCFGTMNTGLDHVLSAE